MPNTFTPTEARGTALAEEVLAEIEAEEAYNNRREEGSTHRINKKNAWQQRTWGEVHLDALPPGTEIELVTDVRRPRDAWALEGYADMAVIDSGVTCGTAMCFAGHAVTLAGDRMLFGINPHAAALLKQKGLKANVKRFVNRFRKDHGHHPVVGGAAGSDYVLTTEGKVEKIEHRARKLLKLNPQEADALFGGSNDLWQLRSYVAQMKDGRNIYTGRKLSRKR